MSKKYTETVCTGGVQPTGEFVRLYPIPFRFLPTEMRYKRWDIIEVDVYKSSKDPRPESWHLVPGSPIDVIEHVASERRRWEWMHPTVFESRQTMEEMELTNGCVQIEPLEFFHKTDDKEWSESQKAVIRQGDLFATEDEMRAIGERVPYQFRLRFREVSTGIVDERKVLAWSYYTGYLRLHSSGKSKLDALDVVTERVKASIFNPKRAVYAIFGTHSRFGHWMISGLYHVPKSITEQRGLL
ncbi:hypothetical protein [Rhodopirellula europaea]|uniref:hypothetical protein n=1 Tax=Rhodopirellula europaea TaxID=1263866 RepID=UPI003D28DDF0